MGRGVPRRPIGRIYVVVAAFDHRGAVEVGSRRNRRLCPRLPGFPSACRAIRAVRSDRPGPRDLRRVAPPGRGGGGGTQVVRRSALVHAFPVSFFFSYSFLFSFFGKSQTFTWCGGIAVLPLPARSPGNLMLFSCTVGRRGPFFSNIFIFISSISFELILTASIYYR